MFRVNGLGFIYSYSVSCLGAMNMNVIFSLPFVELSAEDAAMKASKAEEQRLRAMIASGSDIERCFPFEFTLFDESCFRVSDLV